MAKILSIETSTSNCSVALHDKGELISLSENNEPGAHAEKLIELIDDVLAKAELDYPFLNAIAVSEGPGSYTGLRIGVSTAKGLVYALDKPLIGVNTLQALASIHEYQLGEVGVAVLDARRMEVFSQAFGQKLIELSPIESIVLNETSYSRFLDAGIVYFSGDAVAKVSQVVSHPNAVFLDNSELSARLLGRLAWEKYQSGIFQDLAYFVPNYLKEFQALNSKKNPLIRL